MNNLNIMIVEDEFMQAMFLEETLKSIGYNVIGVSNESTRAIEMALAKKPDLILMDIYILGDTDGIETSIEIHKNTDVPIIFLTSADDEETLNRIKESSPYGYILKPFNTQALRTSIDIAFYRHNIEKKLKESERVANSLYQIVKRDNEIVSKVLKKLFNLNKYLCKNVNYKILPVDEIAGDIVFYKPYEYSKMYALVGDFTGHGLSAAIGGIPVTDIFYSMVDLNLSIEDILLTMNQKLKNILPTGIFLSACMVEMDSKRRTIKIWNGGLPDVLIVSMQGEIKKRISSKNFPLGLLDNKSFELNIDVLETDINDRIYIYSDGVTETANYQHEMFEITGLESLFSSGLKENMIDKIFQELERFRGDSPQKDDITMLEIRCGHCDNCKHLHGIEKIGGKFDMSITFNAEQLRSIDIVSYLFTIIEKEMTLNNHKENIHLILQELITNALDYGILKLPYKLKKSPEGFLKYYEMKLDALTKINEGWIKVELKYVQNTIIIEVTDSGDGFNWKNLETDISDNKSMSGRGLTIVRCLCKEVVFSRNGTNVRAVYPTIMTCDSGV
ncbi:MAG: SpoIIE family protein phosphatase [Desulfobacterales bacterium]|nr:SpoIIE family protein phosphatase [Desulfobacterales bacterium]